MSMEQRVASHYTHGSLQQAIFDALKAMGKDPDRLSASDLSAADEFHLGWRAATTELAKGLGLARGMHVLDVGSGIGGPARFFAEIHGCRVTGIDLTEEFVRVAAELTRRCGLDDLVAFRQGSALDLPFGAAMFDAATLIHVGMNIADKARLFENVRRVLKPGALFGVYEVMRAADGELPYPCRGPRPSRPASSKRRMPIVACLKDAGFTIEREENRREFVLKLADEMREKAAIHGTPPLTLPILMGPAWRDRLVNVMKTLERGTIAPIELIARAAWFEG